MRVALSVSLHTHFESLGLINHVRLTLKFPIVSPDFPRAFRKLSRSENIIFERSETVAFQNTNIYWKSPPGRGAIPLKSCLGANCAILTGMTQLAAANCVIGFCSEKQNFRKPHRDSQSEITLRPEGGFQYIWVFWKAEVALLRKNFGKTKQNFGKTWEIPMKMMIFGDWTSQNGPYQTGSDPPGLAKPCAIERSRS